MSFWLGIDCGGTFIKAGIYDSQGQEIGIYRHNLAVISDYPGWAERDLSQLWQGCIEVIKGVLHKTEIASDLIQGIGISAQGKGLFLLDKQHRPLGRGILSSDQRALAIVKEWQQQGILEKLYPLTRQTLWTGHPVSLLRWLKVNQPEHYQQIGAVLMSHDFLRFCLTDSIACEETNISESNLYNMSTGQYDQKLAELLDIADIMPALPSIIKSTDIAGYITDSVAQKTGLKAGTPVVGGLFDVVSTAICSGINRDNNKLNVVLGTWSVVSGITSKIDTSYKQQFVYGKYVQQNFIIHEASPTSSGNLEWFLKQWCHLDYDQINQMVEQLPKASSEVFFVPFLYGSNAGLGMKAGLYGLQSIHNLSHILQAIYEGVLFSLMVHLEKMLIRFPSTKVLRVTGGATKSNVWMQMLADLTGLVIEIPDINETGCYGASLVAMIGTDSHCTIESLQDDKSYSYRSVYPNLELYEKYQIKYKKYRLLVDSLQHYHRQTDLE